LTISEYQFGGMNSNEVQSNLSNTFSNLIFFKLFKMNCWHCGAELIWGGDADLDEEFHPEYDIYTNLSCPKCETWVEVYHKRETKE